MKTLPAGMQDDLDSAVTTHCTCWKVLRVDGVVMGFTDHDNNVTFNGLTYTATTGFTSAAIKNTSTLAIDDTQADGALSSLSITEEDISAKKYDNAKISIFRVDYTDTTKNVEIFTGYMGTLTRGRLSFKTEIRSMMQALNQPTGNLYTKTCRVDLFSAACGLVVGSDPDFLRNTHVAGVHNRRLLWVTDSNILALAASYYTGGLITWTSGNNVNAQIEVQMHTLLEDDSAAYLSLWESMPYDIAIGDQFSIRVGCDKTIATCKAKFDNVVNFRGFPRMPGQDALVTYPGSQDVFDGGSWYSNT